MTTSGSQRIIILACVAVLMVVAGCNRNGGDPNWQQKLKDGIVGEWEDADHENMTFAADGTLIMSSAREHHNCTYDFPDSKHIRLDCAYPGTPHRPDTWGVSLTSDQLQISDEHETGTYRRKPAKTESPDSQP